MSRFLEPAQTPFGGTNDSFGQIFSPEMRRLDYSGDDFSPAGKSPQQLLLRVYQRMQMGKMLTSQEMHWAFSHGGFYFHQQAGVHQQRMRAQVAKNNAEAGVNKVDASHAITTLNFSENKKDSDKKQRYVTNPLLEDVNNTTDTSKQLGDAQNVEQSALKLYGGGEEKKQLNVKGYLLKEIDLTEAILTGLFGGFYKTVKNSSYFDIKAKVSLESEFPKNVAKGEKTEYSRAYFNSEVQGRLDNHFYKVTANVFQGKEVKTYSDPDNPGINYEFTGDLKLLSLALKGIEPEINIAKLEGKAAYTITQSNLASAFPGIKKILQESWPGLHDGIEKGDTNLKVIFSISVALQLKDIAKIIKNAIIKGASKQQIQDHKEKADEHKNRERENSKRKKESTKKRNKLNDEISKKEKQLEKLNNSTSDADIEKRAKLQEEIAEKNKKLIEIQSEIDKAKDNIDDARKKKQAEDKAIKKIKDKARKASAENKKLTTASKKGKKLTKTQRINKLTEKILRKGGELAEKIINKTVNKAVQRIVRKAIVTVVKLALRLIPVIGWLLSAWDLITTLWDIGKTIWDWFTNDDKKEGGGGSDEDGDESNEQSSGDGVDGTGQGTGSGEGTGTGIGSGEGAGSGSGEKAGAGGTVTGGQNITGAGTEKSDAQKQPNVEGQQGGGTTGEKVEKKEDKSWENLEISQSEEVVNGSPAAGFSSLRYIAPSSQQNLATISNVKLVGFFNGKSFSTFQGMTFIRGINTNGESGYFAASTFSFELESKSYFIEKGKFVKNIYFEL